MPETVQETTSRLFEVLAPITGLSADELSAVDSLHDLGLESVDYVEVAHAIKLEFGQEVGPARLFALSGMSELITELTGEEVGSEEADSTVSHASTGSSREPIAIIGIALDVPGASDMDTFWDRISTGKDSITEIAASRPSILRDHLDDHGDLTGIPSRAGFIDGIENFDADFFGISPLEAQSMDPQQRKLLQLCWHVIEESGYRPSALAGLRVGVHCAVNVADYTDLLVRSAEDLETYGAYADSGLHPTMVANRVSRWFDFRGPSETVNTACSGSLFALHHAVRALREGSCEMAIAAAGNALLAARTFALTNRAGMLSPNGRCAAFDHRADGYVRSEGFSAVLLKPLSAALAAEDRILAVIRGTAVGHDGRAGSLRAPNPNAQSSVVVAALADAEVEADSISYVEAHGTGTLLGDPIEIEGLNLAFAEAGFAGPAGSCAVGSVKTSIGHLEAAAGMAGLCKIVACMHHAELPALLHFEQVNPHLQLDGSPFHLLTENEPWLPTADESGQSQPRRAGLSSFGYGGSVAHLVVEESPEAPASTADSTTLPLLLSAQTESALRELASRFATHLRRHRTPLPTLTRGLLVREPMPWRLALVSEDLDTTIVALDRFGQNLESLPDGPVVRHTEVVTSTQEESHVAEAVSHDGSNELPDAVADRWLAGLDGPWVDIVHSREAAGLPGYAFAATPHWLTSRSAAEKTSIGRLHPLVKANVSDFQEQSFLTSFSGREALLSDHVVHGEPTLPASAWLEAVLFCIDSSSRAPLAWPLVLTDLRWGPSYIPSFGDVHIVVMPTDAGDIEFDCLVPAEGRILCQGTFKPESEVSAPTIAQLKGSDQPISLLDDSLKEVGVRHGDSFDLVVQLQQSTEAAGALKAQLRTSQDRRPGHSYLLPPAAITRAIELAWFGTKSMWTTTASPALSAIERLTIFDSVTDDFEVISTPRSDQRLDLLITAEDRVLVMLEGVEFAGAETRATAS